jgi:hypothetical protein
MRLREASTGARDPEGIVYRADCQAKKLCQEILTTDPMLIIVAIEVSIQNLIKEVREASELEEGAASKSSASRSIPTEAPLFCPVHQDLKANSVQSRSLPSPTKNPNQRKSRELTG